MSAAPPTIDSPYGEQSVQHITFLLGRLVEQGQSNTNNIAALAERSQTTSETVQRMDGRLAAVEVRVAAVEHRQDDRAGQDAQFALARVNQSLSRRTALLITAGGGGLTFLSNVLLHFLK